MKDEIPQDMDERTTEFALRMVKRFTALPKTEEARTLGKQGLRSGTSIGANDHEARWARSTAEFISKIGDCLKELDAPSGARQTMRQHCPEGERGGAHQTHYWHELLVRGGMVPEAKLSALRDETNQINAILTTISKNAKRRND